MRGPCFVTDASCVASSCSCLLSTLAPSHLLSFFFSFLSFFLFSRFLSHPSEFASTCDKNDWETTQSLVLKGFPLLTQETEREKTQIIICGGKGENRSFKESNSIKLCWIKPSINHFSQKNLLFSWKETRQEEVKNKTKIGDKRNYPFALVTMMVSVMENSDLEQRRTKHPLALTLALSNYFFSPRA